jgi:hypothetical protein
MNIVKIISSKIDSSGKIIAKFLRFGKDDVRESVVISPYGFDSNPIANMRAIYSQTESNGDSVIIGYINVNQVTKEGESRIFATDSNGNIQIYIHLKDDGSIEFGGDTGNLTRFQELESAFNEMKGDLNDMISKWNSFVVAYVPGSPASVGTPPTLAGQNVQPSTADISGAKIEEFKTL